MHVADVGVFHEDLEKIDAGSFICFIFSSQIFFGIVLISDSGPLILVLDHPQVGEASVLGGSLLQGPFFLYADATIVPDVRSLNLVRTGDRMPPGKLVRTKDGLALCGHFNAKNNLRFFDVQTGRVMDARDHAPFYASWKIVQPGRDGKDVVLWPVVDR